VGIAHPTSNQISHLPENIDNLFNLTDLNLSKNHIDVLPDSIGNLGHNLISIDISNNYLTQLPDSIGNLFILENLNLADNQLDNLPVSFRMLTNLKWLNLNGNPLDDLSNCQALHNLETQVSKAGISSERELF
jgi:Leucine-rich repeat (LRR) protein